jgi:hypothetical protein
VDLLAGGRAENVNELTDRGLRVESSGGDIGLRTGSL